MGSITGRGSDWSTCPALLSLFPQWERVFAHSQVFRQTDNRTDGEQRKQTTKDSLKTQHQLSSLLNANTNWEGVTLHTYCSVFYSCFGLSSLIPINRNLHLNSVHPTLWQHFEEGHLFFMAMDCQKIGALYHFDALLLKSVEARKVQTNFPHFPAAQ